MFIYLYKREHVGGGTEGEGENLKQTPELGAHHQIISITHLPQVAALADHQFVVRKVVRMDRTHSQLNRVDGEDRVLEIARMLGGKAESARAHARNLLAGGG